MPATTPEHANGGPIREDPGRPHVPDTAGNERNTPIMAHAFVPQQRSPKPACTVLGCVSDHHGEQPGQYSHWIDGQTIDTATGTLLVDLNLMDGGRPHLVLHDSDGEHERRLAAVEAIAYGSAIIAAATTLLRGVMA
jgi:hypothetical protein